MSATRATILRKVIDHEIELWQAKIAKLKGGNTAERIQAANLRDRSDVLDQLMTATIGVALLKQELNDSTYDDEKFLILCEAAELSTSSPRKGAIRVIRAAQERLRRADQFVL